MATLTTLAPLAAQAPAKALLRHFEEQMTSLAVASMTMPAPFGWPGGKNRLKKRIIALIPPHKTYVEPFAGAASVFWAKQPSAREVLNDIDADLMHFYRNIGQVAQCDTATVAKDWDRLKAKRGNLEPCEFFSAVKCSFGQGMFARGRSLGSKQCTDGQLHFHQSLDKYRKRLAQTNLHNEDWETVVRRYDASDSFFYLDPPYHGTSRRYAAGSLDVLPRLARVLPSLKGKWLLSYDDHPDVRAAFKGFCIKPITTVYTISAASNRLREKELLIANYPLGVSAMFQGYAAAQAPPLALLSALQSLAVQGMQEKGYRGKIQSLVFSKAHFTEAQAKAWAARHGYRYGKVDETPNTYRLRQFNPGSCPTTFRTFSLTRGVQGVVCTSAARPHQAQNPAYAQYLTALAQDWRCGHAQTKHPWEMTRAEFKISENDPRVSAIQAAIRRGAPIVLATAYRAIRLTKPGHIRMTGLGTVQIPQGRSWVALTDGQVTDLAAQAGIKPVALEDRIYHHAEVKRALEQGKPVPAEVLADYPDLARLSPIPRQFIGPSELPEELETAIEEEAEEQEEASVGQSFLQTALYSAITGAGATLGAMLVSKLLPQPVATDRRLVGVIDDTKAKPAIVEGDQIHADLGPLLTDLNKMINSDDLGEVSTRTLRVIRE